MEVRIRKAPHSYQLSYYPLSPGHKEPKDRHACFKQCQLLCDSSRLRNIWGEWSPCFGVSACCLWLSDILPWDVRANLPPCCGSMENTHAFTSSYAARPNSQGVAVTVQFRLYIWGKWKSKKIHCKPFLKVEMTFLLSLHCSAFPKHINIELEKYKMWIITSYILLSFDILQEKARMFLLHITLALLSMLEGCRVLNIGMKMLSFFFHLKRQTKKGGTKKTAQ